MTSHHVRVKISGNELNAIFEELDKAVATIGKCYNRLEELGVVELEAEEAASDN